jgi:2-methylisocitrate lyase-like PEP mutase family enzyme
VVDMSDPATDLSRRCADLRVLHRPGHPVVLPNVWDAASARAVAAAGYPAVATSSGAVAETLGFEDHEGAPADEMFAAAARIVAAVAVPVTVDAEAGYGMTAGELVQQLIAIGAAGANLEDTDHSTGGQRPLDVHAAWLAEVRAAADAAGVPVVVNARIDNFLSDRSGDQRRHVDDAVARATAYLAAGADCVYPILLGEPGARDAFIAAVDGPVNLLTWPGGATVAELAAAGAARVSFGGTLHRQVMTVFTELVDGIGSPE